jgi:undecaprenyl-diphosphatase
MKRNRTQFFLPGLLLGAFLLWTAGVCLVDVRPIGPMGSQVGFAGLNGWFHSLTGVHWWLYDLTDLLGLASLGICGIFGLQGLCQWVRRKSIRRVDGELLALGGFYLTVLAVFFLFELLEVNYRPVLIEGRLETSYPSSTTMLALCVLPTAMLRLRSRWVRFLLAALTAFLVLGRLLCGVHWVSDIIGGALLSAGLVTLYRCIISICFSSKL